MCKTSLNFCVAVTIAIVKNYNTLMWNSNELCLWVFVCETYPIADGGEYRTKEQPVLHC